MVVNDKESTDYTGCCIQNQNFEKVLGILIFSVNITAEIGDKNKQNSRETECICSVMKNTAKRVPINET
jgi:hypothetical protein